MKLSKVSIKNFRRLEAVDIDIEETETVFVGPNNSGKTSASAVFRCFFGQRQFQIHDFSVSQVPVLNKFVDDVDGTTLPNIALDLWFTIDPSTIAYGRAASLLPRLSSDYKTVGMRLSFGFSHPAALRAAYNEAYPPGAEARKNTLLCQYLAMDGNLGHHTHTSYSSLEKTNTGVIPHPLEKDEGKKLLHSLIKVNFVDAQRNIDDEDSRGSTRLSSAFAAYYKKNLEQAEAAAEAHRVIGENNSKLTTHYESQFGPLLSVIGQLGVPSINDRKLRIISSLSPQEALRGSTDLLYVDPELLHELPEVYNGLGFKNLTYIAIQARHYFGEWVRMSVNRPFCQLQFIEEPEAHLHAQVQQTFIRNVRNVIAEAAKETGADALVPQIIVSTHSSHVLDAVDFGSVRYFRRCALRSQTGKIGILNASEVRSLRTFYPLPEKRGAKEAVAESGPSFLARYLRLTHCDMFFADAVILVEGAAEKLLFGTMMNAAAPKLHSAYLTILEVGGAYAHRFERLLEFLDIPYLIITDLDSVSASGNHSSCRADTIGAVTSNATLKKLLRVKTVRELMELTPETKGQAHWFVAFQTDVQVSHGDRTRLMRPRTFEEAIAYHNFGALKSHQRSIGIEIPDDLDEAYERIYQHIHSGGFKKTDFAMSLLEGNEAWNVPDYIREGLQWLEKRLFPAVEGKSWTAKGDALPN